MSNLMIILSIAAIINLFLLHLLTKYFKFKNISFYKALITIGVGLAIGVIWYGFTSEDPFYVMEILWSIATILLIKYLYDVDWKSCLKVWIILLIVGTIVETIVALFLMGII